MEWQPINTALKDKDAEPILAYWPDGGIGIVHWYLGSWWSDPDCEWTKPPTHWMPLPQPPEQAHASHRE
jgi:hypothetical protein